MVFFASATAIASNTTLLQMYVLLHTTNRAARIKDNHADEFLININWGDSSTATQMPANNSLSSDAGSPQKWMQDYYCE